MGTGLGGPDEVLLPRSVILCWLIVVVVVVRDTKSFQISVKKRKIHTQTPLIHKTQNIYLFLTLLLCDKIASPLAFCVFFFHFVLLFDFLFRVKFAPLRPLYYFSGSFHASALLFCTLFTNFISFLNWFLHFYFTLFSHLFFRTCHSTSVRSLCNNFIYFYFLF